MIPNNAVGRRAVLNAIVSRRTALAPRAARVVDFAPSRNPTEKSATQNHLTTT